MKRAILFLFLFVVMATIVFPQKSSGHRRVLRLAKKMNAAYSLTSLDSLGVVRGRLKVEIEHSIIEPEFETRWVKNFAGAERWLKSRENSEGFPRRYSLPLKSCVAGVCTFESVGGILHNQLYLKQIRYRYRNARVIVTAIRFLDGD